MYMYKARECREAKMAYVKDHLKDALDLVKQLTTVSQSGGWVPETSRSFYYWQPAPNKFMFGIDSNVTQRKKALC